MLPSGGPVSCGVRRTPHLKPWSDDATSGEKAGVSARCGPEQPARSSGKNSQIRRQARNEGMSLVPSIEGGESGVEPPC